MEPDDDSKKMSSEPSTAGKGEPSADPEATGAIPKRVAEGNDSAARRREAKFRRKDPKYLANILKTLDPNPTTAAFEVLKAKYSLLYEEQRKSVASYDALEKYCANLKKENDHSQVELTKSIMTSARLENICRELQKQNKLIKEDNIAKIKEEEERRKEISTKFSDKLVDINTMMEDSKDKSEKLRQENLQMTKKFTELYNQFQEREQDIYKVTEQLKLEREYNAATLKQVELQLKAEREFHEQESKALRDNLDKSEKNCGTLLETIKELNGHIEVYKKQYQDFESTMCKSNSVFDNLKKQLGKMNQQIFKLEKEIVVWKTKYQQSVTAMLQMTEDKQKHQLDMVVMTKKIDQLVKLSRQLQADRTAYLKLLKDNNIDTDDVPKHVELFQPAANAKESLLGHLKTELSSLTEELQRVQLRQTEGQQPEVQQPEVHQPEGHQPEGHQPETQQLVGDQSQDSITSETNRNYTSVIDGHNERSRQDLDVPVDRNGTNPVAANLNAVSEDQNESSVNNDGMRGESGEDFVQYEPDLQDAWEIDDVSPDPSDVSLSSDLHDLNDSSVSELECFVTNHGYCGLPLANSTPVPVNQTENDAVVSISGEEVNSHCCGAPLPDQESAKNSLVHNLADASSSNEDRSTLKVKPTETTVQLPDESKTSPN